MWFHHNHLIYRNLLHLLLTSGDNATKRVELLDAAETHTTL